MHRSPDIPSLLATGGSPAKLSHAGSPDIDFPVSSAREAPGLTRERAVNFARALLVGAEAAAIRPSLAMSDRPIQIAATLLEAVLISESEADTLIVADVRAEIDHLEQAVRSLRDVNPAARIVLLCEPADEAPCRRALGWGADDYFIVPLDGRSLARIARHDTGAAHSATPPRDSAVPARAIPERELADMPAMPLMLQTELLEEILEGNVRPEFAERAAATVKRALRIRGELKFAPGETDVDAGGKDYRRAVSIAGQPQFGTLIWTPAGDAGFAGEEASTLAQAAHWLGAMLALSQRYEQLRSLAITDELSGAYNRRYFIKFMTGLLERAAESRFRVTLLLFDIDDFKKYNDQFGHASGDAIIRELIRLLRACTRPHDLVARIGGDEFAVVYWDNEPKRQPNSDHPKEILAATERFREAIKNHSWAQACNIKGQLSISGGLATFPWDAKTLETLMAKADEALLKAKAAGKNVILLHERT